MEWDLGVTFKGFPRMADCKWGGVGAPKIHQLFTNQILLPRRLSQDTLKLNFKLGLLQLRTQRAGREKKNVRFVS